MTDTADGPSPALIAAMAAAPSAASDQSSSTVPDTNDAPVPSTVSAMDSSDQPSAALIAAMSPTQSSAATPSPHRQASPTPAPAAHQTRFQQAAAPVPEAQPELTWGQTAQGAVQNFVPSVGGVLGSVVKAVSHPIKTVETLGQVGSGFLSQAEDALGIQQDPQQATKAQALAKALEHHYATAYGSVKGFKQAVATDPASVLMDASTVLGGTGAIADAAGLAKTAGVLSKVGSAVDPVTNALRVAKLPITAVAKAMPVAQSFTSGSSIGSLAKAAQAGAEANPASRAAFLSHLNGTANPTDIVDTAQNAITKLSNARSAKYVANKAALTNGVLPPIGWQPVNDALANAQAAVRITDPTTGVSRVVNDGADKALTAIQNEVNFYQNQPSGSVFSNLEGFDALKRNIGDIRNTYKTDPVAYQKATEMYNAVLSTIKQEHPDYSSMMQDYGDASDQLAQLRTTFGLKNNANDELVLRRLLNTKTSANKQNLLGQLAEQEPTLPYMLAGHELNPLLPGGIRQAINYAAAPFSYGVNPLLAAGQAAVASPRVMGALNYGAGKAAGAVGSLLRRPVTTGVYYAGRADQEQNSQGSAPDSAPPVAPTAPATADPIFNKMLHIESGNQQFHKNGQPIVSPKGAVGAAQIMPSTGPQAAALAGESWDPDRLANDKDYNTKLGHAYYQHLVEQFGDPVLGAAAYNAGPAALQKALIEAHSTGSNWLDHLPAETRNYVRYVSEPKPSATGGRIERANGGAALSHEQLVDRLMTRAEQAKKASDAATKPLLQVPDNAIVKALDVAQRAI